MIENSIESPALLDFRFGHTRHIRYELTRSSLEIATAVAPLTVPISDIPRKVGHRHTPVGIRLSRCQYDWYGAACLTNGDRQQTEGCYQQTYHKFLLLDVLQQELFDHWQEQIMALGIEVSGVGALATLEILLTERLAVGLDIAIA